MENEIERLEGPASWLLDPHESVVMLRYEVEKRGFTLSRQGTERALDCCRAFTNIGEHQVPFNPHVFCLDLLEKHPYWPTAPKELRALLLWYKQFWPSTKTNIGQGGTKVAQTLRNNGFVFERTRGKGDEILSWWTPDGEHPIRIKGRKIIRVDPDFKPTVETNGDIHPERRRKYLKDKHQCEVCKGLSGDRNFEMDHRKPVRRCLEEGVAPARIEKNSTDEHIHEHFQVLCRKCNTRKRERCGKCIEHEVIDVEPAVTWWAEKVGYHFPTTWEGSCDRCFWHTPNPKVEVIAATPQPRPESPLGILD